MSERSTRLLAILNEDLSPWTFHGNEPMAVRLLALLHELEDRNAILEAALRFVECGGEAGACPACGCGPYDGSPWHRNGCELAVALGLPQVTP